MRTIIKTKELPIDIQVLLKSVCDFNKQEVKVEPTIDFACPGNWHDYNIQRMFVYNQVTGEHKGITAGNYDNHLSWNEQERAMYLGKITTKIPDPSIWIFVTDSYPKQCTVYCHPDAISKLVSAPKIELTEIQSKCLFYARALISSARPKGPKWTTAKAELYAMGLMRANGSLTTEGKNIAQDLNYNTWGDF